MLDGTHSANMLQIEYQGQIDLPKSAFEIKNLNQEINCKPHLLKPHLKITSTKSEFFSEVSKRVVCR